MTHSFHQRAHTYEAHAHIQAKAAISLAEWISPSKRNGTTIEFGAGTGLLTRQLLPWDGPYLATDLSPAMIATGRASTPQAHWRVMDARTPSIPFDTRWLLSSSMLQWMDDPLATLKTWKASAPAARLALSVFTRCTLQELETVLPDCFPLTWHDSDTWRSWIRQSGWRIIKSQTTQTTEFHPCAISLLHTLRAFGATGAPRVSPARLRAALQSYDRIFSTPQGTPATWQTLKILAAP